MSLVPARLNFYSLFYTTFFTFCSGFVLISSVAGSYGTPQLFSLGEKIVYDWRSTVLLNEIEGKTKNFGFSLEGKVTVSSLWERGDQRVLELEIASPKLQLQSKSGSSSGTLTPQHNLNSYLNSHGNRPCIILLNKGVAEKFLIASSEPTDLKNIKKGVASLFQFRSQDGETTETDASGNCDVLYSSTKNAVKKIKTSCVYDDPESLKHQEDILGTKMASTRTTEYIIDNELLKSIVSRENHNIFFHAKQELGGSVYMEQNLTYAESQACDAIKANSPAEVITQLTTRKHLDLKEESLVAEVEMSRTDGERTKFSKEVGSLRGSLKSEHLGKINSAKAFLHILNSARISSSEEISEALGSKKNSKILFQLYDILGYSQTSNSHKAVMKHLHLDSEEHMDLTERYLWAISFSVHPNIDILEDLLNKYRKYTKIPDRVRDTLILSLASMSRTLSRSHSHEHGTLKVLRNLEETIINGLDYAKDVDRYVFLNALKNLQSPSTLPKLVAVIKNGTVKEEVLAWRALKSFSKEFWTQDLLKQAEKTLFELDKKHDTSSRTIAVDLLLGSEITDANLSNLLNFVASNETNFEIKQYVFQCIKMLSDKCEAFNQRVLNIIRGSKKLNNWSTLSPRGLSTALRRNIFSGSSANGSLVSIQEIKSGIVKRGVVDVVLDKNGVSKEIFTLGIFASGLSTFVSSDSDEEDETSTAGMELTIFGTQIRPFVFFEGQGELMGHVWSGTASDMTPAFQALILTQDHKEFLRLGNGFIAEIDLKGATSFDLSGKIETSIWNRNAQSLIKKSVGHVSKGMVKVQTSFVKSQIEFEGTIEPKLSLEIDADFSNNVKLCMRLSQPDAIFSHDVTKIAVIPGSEHQLKLALSRRNSFPGTTYALNRKNSEMCSAIFS